MTTKEELRKKYLEIRNNIENYDIKSNLIADKIRELKTYQKAHIIAIYKSLPKEVNTDYLIEDALNKSKIVLLPKTIENDMEFYQIISLDNNLIKGPFGVLEPVANKDNYVPKEKIDLIIVPGVCFDRKGNRLGFGKGYYDKYLSDTNIDKIGICFHEQLTDKTIPTDEYDVGMKLVVTDQEIIEPKTHKKSL